jgi:hypothetical protein
LRQLQHGFIVVGDSRSLHSTPRHNGHFYILERRKLEIFMNLSKSSGHIGSSLFYISFLLFSFDATTFSPFLCGSECVMERGRIFLFDNHKLLLFESGGERGNCCKILIYDPHTHTHHWKAIKSDIYQSLIIYIWDLNRAPFASSSSCVISHPFVSYGKTSRKIL